MARSTRTLAIATPLADRLALAAVQQQQRVGHQVTQRSLAEQAIETLLADLDQGPAIVWPAANGATEAAGRTTRNLIIDTALADRLALVAVQQRASAGRSVSMREVAEVAITRLLDKQG